MPQFPDSDDDDPPSLGRPRSKTLVAESQESSPTTRSRAVLTISTGTDTGRVFAIPAREVVTLGSESCQGFYFAPPMSPADFDLWTHSVPAG